MSPDAPPVYSGEDLHQFRMSLDWKLGELARFTGYSKGFLSKVERNLKKFPKPLARILSDNGAKPQ